MKISSAAVFALGYLAGNESARTKTMDTLKRWNASPQAKAVEDKVSAKVTSTVTQLSSKAGLRRNGDSVDEEPTPMTSGQVSTL
jgi:hypothetical protein